MGIERAGLGRGWTDIEMGFGGMRLIFGTWPCQVLKAQKPGRLGGSTDGEEDAVAEEKLGKGGPRAELEWPADTNHANRGQSVMARVELESPSVPYRFYEDRLDVARAELGS